MVEVDRLERRFGDFVAVDRISFGFRAGDIFGFVGPNGAGKTTTMRILATLDAPTTGDARVNGVSVVDYPDEIRSSIGFMPDHLSVYTNLYVEEYLDFFARTYGLSGRRRREAVQSVMDFTELHSLRRKMCDTLSKGMRQRLGLARTLIHDPKVLILDEPASGLDPRARIEFRALLEELSRRGKGILISSHILTELSEICNVVAIIERGKLLTCGAIEEIRKNLRRHSVIRIGFLDRIEEAHKKVMLYPGVQAVRVAGKELEVEFVGDEAARAALLKNLVQGGLPVVQFAGHEQNLEDIFMEVTKGQVQ
ncbi:MAG: ABC transporter ATP-binding protein [Planctomycetes bacterium]|nr:ABC transporter ATP-binding protein [Planctomycetota bacterium]